MTRSCWLVLLVALAGCGSSGTPAGSPTASSGGGHVTLDVSGGKHDVSGPSFARLDTGTKELLVFTFRGDTEPAPSCETLSAPDKMKRGGFVSVSVPSFAGAPGRFPVGAAGVLLGDSDKGDLTALTTAVAGTTLTLRTYGNDAFSGDLASTGAAPSVNGSVAGRICPSIATAAAAPEQTPPAEASPAASPKAPVVAKLDAEGVAGITLGMAVAKLPKQATKKPPQPGQSTAITVYDAKGAVYMGQPIVTADILVAGDAVRQMTAGTKNCPAVLSKLKERYGEGGTTGLGKVWHGTKSELTVIPFSDGQCLITLTKLPETKPASSPGKL